MLKWSSSTNSYCYPCQIANMGLSHLPKWLGNTVTNSYQLPASISFHSYIH